MTTIISRTGHWLSQSTDTDQGSCDSLNVRSAAGKRRLKLNSALILGQRDILINLKKKMKKKTPRYQVRDCKHGKAA